MLSNLPSDPPIFHFTPLSISCIVHPTLLGPARGTGEQLTPCPLYRVFTSLQPTQVGMHSTAWGSQKAFACRAAGGHKRVASLPRSKKHLLYDRPCAQHLQTDRRLPSGRLEVAVAKIADRLTRKIRHRINFETSTEEVTYLAEFRRKHGLGGKALVSEHRRNCSLQEDRYGDSPRKEQLSASKSTVVVRCDRSQP